MSKKPEDIRLGQRIKDIRRSLELDQKSFADKIKSTVSALSNWENGRNKPNDLMLKRISDLGNISINELLYGPHKAFVKEVFTEAILEQGDLYSKILDYLIKVNKATEKDAYEQIFKFVEENFNSLYDFLYTADLNNPGYSKAYDANTITETAINYFEYRLNATEKGYELNENVTLYLLGPIKFKYLENKDDYEGETRYVIAFDISLTTTKRLRERARVELDYICHPSIEIRLRHEKNTNYYSIVGMSDFVDSHYERIYGEKTYKQLKDRLLEFALKKDYLKEYNVESFEELT